MRAQLNEYTLGPGDLSTPVPENGMQRGTAGVRLRPLICSDKRDRC